MTPIPTRKPKPSFCNTAADRNASTSAETEIAIHESHLQNCSSALNFRL